MTNKTEENGKAQNDSFKGITPTLEGSEIPSSIPKNLVKDKSVSNTLYQKRIFSNNSLRAYLKKHLPKNVRVTSEAVAALNLMLDNEFSKVIRLSATRATSDRGQDLMARDLEAGLNQWKMNLVKTSLEPAAQKLAVASEALEHILMCNAWEEKNGRGN